MEPGKLFIGGISWDTSEERLREYFQTFGEIVEAVIMRDRTTGRARGFGFIVFADASVAEKVVTERHIIDGRTRCFLEDYKCIICSLVGVALPGQTNPFCVVNNIQNSECILENLKRTNRCWYRLNTIDSLDSKYLMDSHFEATLTTRHGGFHSHLMCSHFEILSPNHFLKSRYVEAKKAVPRDDHQNFSRNNGSIQGSPGPTRTKKIFVGGLASTVTETDFKKYFDQFGTITDVVVMYDHNTQRPRGFGFITFESEEAVDKVLFKTFHELNGKMVEVKRAVPKELSPGPARSQSGGSYTNYSLNRVSSFLNAYTQGYSNSNSPMRMEGRFSPVTAGRNGYPLYSPSNYNMGLNLDSGIGLNYGPSQDSGLGYARGVNSYYSGNTNRFGGGPVYDAGLAGNGQLANSVNRNPWGNNGILSYNSNSNTLTSNAFVGSGAGNTGSRGSFGIIGEIWGSSPFSAQVGGGGGSVATGNSGYGIGGNNFGGRAEYGGKNGETTPSYSIAKSIRDEGLGNLYGSGSFYGDHGWRSSSPELVGSASFGYGGGANGDVTPNNSVGYVGGYSVNARTNRGNCSLGHHIYRMDT
ncbi:hypothetical protein OROGR_001215 [Orobanche gracilis]